ncbi:MAG: response regulator [Chloroflexi bacterium]|nr:response regulator [Chloroflexota bacterium]
MPGSPHLPGVFDDVDGDGASQAMEELRLTSLRYIIILVAAGHFIWNTAITATSPYEVSVRAWLLFPLVVGGELISYRLLSRGYHAAARFFLLWGITATTASIWLFQASEALFLYPLLALTTTIVSSPRAGLLMVVGEGGVMTLLVALAPIDSLGPREVGLTLLAAALTVVISWTLMHSLMVAVHWSLNSYEQARCNMQEAQEHRGKLVQALGQLDAAYYRLQRANAALAEAYRRAEDAERAKAEFAANISHELRTPLNLITGFSEMMISAPENYGTLPLPREYRGDLHAIYRSAQYLLALTNDVLDLAQVEVQRLALVSEPTDLAEVVRDSVDIVREYVAAKQLDLCLQIEEGLPRMHLDGLRVRQVLLNLLTNAVRYTEHGRISVAVARQGDEVMVCVADTGRGISPEKMGKIFEHFQHVDERAAREHLSTGLGLAISKRFIELHGGRLGVESTVGVGTTFQFTLPIVAMAGDGVEPVNRRSRGVQTPRAERMLVLAHEDRSLKHIFQRRLGTYRVVSASDLTQAVQLGYELRATAIVADSSVSDGVEGPTPIIRCPLPHKHQLRRALGVADYLVKPVTRAELRASVERLGIEIHRVLVVDDDLRVVRLLARMIRATWHGFEVLTAYNGDEALATMRASPPDLVILDLMMPGRSGQEVLDSMAEEPKLATLPVIVVSARGPDEEKLPLRGEVVVRKQEGLEMTELMNVIEAILMTLRPPQAYLTAREPEPAAGRSESPAWPDTRRPPMSEQPVVR